jgi:hypothetical protein
MRIESQHRSLTARITATVDVAVQPQELGVRPQEAFRVGLARQQLPALLLERHEIARADVDPLLNVLSREVAVGARFAKAGPDLEHSQRVDAPATTGKPPFWGLSKWSRGGSNP